MKILAIVNHRPQRNPGQRFRIEQYLRYLEGKGIEINYSYFISEKDDRFLYKKGQFLKKVLFHFKAMRIRRKDIRSAKNYDAVFIYREAYLFGNIKVEKRIRKRVKKIIFDFDDAVWLPNISEANKKFKWLKDSSKTQKIIALSDMVLAGNEYLKVFAEEYNANVRIVPTTIDTEEYKSLKVIKDESKITIGWSGSITTIQHFHYAVGFLTKIKEKYGEKIDIVVIGDKTYTNKPLDVKAFNWKKDTEIEDLCAFDIGIMPLPDDAWSKGKCGLKGLQYMALEIPTIMSPVGVNTEIIQDGENGFLADTDEEWLDKLSQLIESKALREKLGKAGRKTVEEKYSVNAWKDTYVSLFQELVDNA